MSSGQRKVRHSFNKTIIKNGRIIRITTDGRIKSDLGPYIVNHKENKK